MLLESKTANTPDRLLRVGVISTGFIAERFVAAAHASSKVQVTAIASRTVARAEEAATAWGVDEAFGSYTDLLECSEVDAVYIGLPNSMHVPWTTEALRHGKHVLCEKPLSRRPEEVEVLFDLAEEAGLLVSEAFMYRHHPQTRALADLVMQGAIGELQTIRAALSFVVWEPESNVRLRKDLDGGALMDVGCYCVSAARLLAGEPNRVYGEQVVGPSGVDERFHGTLLFDNDIVAHIDAGLRSRHASLTVVGSEGALLVADPWHCRQPGIELQRPSGESERLDVESASTYQLEIDDLASAIRGKSTLLLGRADAVGQARTISALYRSAETRMPVLLYDR